MEYIQIELKKTKFFAYFFDGKEESAKEFCRKWDCNYVQDFIDGQLTTIVLPDGKRCYVGNYIVIDGKRFSTYTKEEFLKTFTVIPNYRELNYPFFSED